jgi:hypothetical protein
MLANPHYIKLFQKKKNLVECVLSNKKDLSELLHTFFNNVYVFFLILFFLIYSHFLIFSHFLTFSHIFSHSLIFSHFLSFSLILNFSFSHSLILSFSHFLLLFSLSLFLSFFLLSKRIKIPQEIIYIVSLSDFFVPYSFGSISIFIREQINCLVFD